MLILPQAEELPVVVGTLVGAVGVDGHLLPVQSETIRAVGAALGLGPLDPSPEPVGPDEAAAAITDEHRRHQLVQTMVVLSFMEHPPSDERLRSVRRYARAFGIHDRAVDVFGAYAHDHIKRMVFDIYRYLPFVEWERHFVGDEGLGNVAREVLATFDKSESPAVAAKFQALESCPAASLGRKVWEMYQRHGWPFPGERGGVPEATTVHDWVHVLVGYEPTAIGEIQVTALIAASSDEPKAFAPLVLALALYEAGAFKLPNVPQSEGGVMAQPHAAAAFADSIRRGMALNTELLEGIDHWALADQPVLDLRQRFNVVAKDEPEPTIDPGL